MASIARADDLEGTALPAVRYLLVEDPGPWGPAAHPTGALPAPAAEHVERMARSLGARLLLVRRPGRTTSNGSRRFALADLGTGTVAWGLAPSAAALADIDPLRDAVTGDATTYLVCAHGRHDLCCAVEGRPVARILAERDPAATWECTHIGGDRFAANVVVLPSGLVYGRVTPDDVDELVDAQRDGVIIPRLLRGRSGIAPAAQVAEAHARRSWGERRIAAVESDVVEHVGHGAWLVTGRNTHDGRTFRAELRETHRSVEPGITCASLGSSLLRVWSLERLDS